MSQLLLRVISAQRWFCSKAQASKHWISAQLSEFMLIKRKSRHDRPDAPAENLTMVSAIFGAVADFAKPAEEKLKAVVRAGEIAEAFLAGANTTPPPRARDEEALRGNGSEGKPGTANRVA
jgi:hypothetical protein